MKYITLFSLIFTIALQTSCDQSERSVTLIEPYVGTWQIQVATKDGTLQSEWTNQTLTVEQETEGAGTYELIETPYDTIWSPTGTWTKFDDISFILNDSISVSYWIKNDSLYLLKSLPWTSKPNDPEIDEFLPSVTGIWNFFLTK